MNAGYTGHLNNLDYSICVKQEYGFCGIEYGPVKDELGSFSMTNKTEFFIDEEIVAHTGYFLIQKNISIFFFSIILIFQS